MQCFSESDVCLSASCTAPSVQSISRSVSVGAVPSANSASPLLLLPSSSTTGSPDEMRSSREMASPPRNIATTAGCSETTATIKTASTPTTDGYIKETYGNLQTRSDVITTESNKVLTGSNSTIPKPHVADTLSPSATDRKTMVEKEKGNEVFASVFASSATKIKCTKNQDNNIRYEEAGNDGQRHNCQPTKSLSRRRRNKREMYQQYGLYHRVNIQQIPEIVARCENSARECKKALDDMNRLLRKNWIEKFWQQWTL